MLRRIGIIAVLSLIALALAAPAWAISPHFISASGSVDKSTGALLVSFKEAGLGTNQQIDYQVNIGSATANYQCYNKPGNVPQAANKQVGPTDLNLALGSFNSGKNGQVTKTNLTVPGTPLSQGSFSCPPGQVLYLDSVSYNNVTIVDTTNDVSSDPFSTGTVLLHIRIS